MYNSISSSKVAITTFVGLCTTEKKNKTDPDVVVVMNAGEIRHWQQDPPNSPSEWSRPRDA